MPKYAYFDHTASQPARVIGWLDTDLIPNQTMPAAADLLQLSADQWAGRLATPYVQNGALTATGPDLYTVQPDPDGGGTGGTTAVLTYKTDIWRRCTDTEADQLDAALQQAPVKLRRLWDDSTYIDHAAAEYTDLIQPMVAAFGQARTDEIMAPS